MPKPGTGQAGAPRYQNRQPNLVYTMVTNNHTACGLAQEAANNQRSSNRNSPLLREWFRYYHIRRIYLTDEEISTLRALVDARSGVA